MPARLKTPQPRYNRPNHAHAGSMSPPLHHLTSPSSVPDAHSLHALFWLRSSCKIFAIPIAHGQSSPAFPLMRLAAVNVRYFVSLLLSSSTYPDTPQTYHLKHTRSLPGSIGVPVYNRYHFVIRSTCNLVAAGAGTTTSSAVP
ncbi:hypothetical protein PAXRUDRAFT_411832 [Paxillus rubicundulus Ve08.2h10]|uniref:Uncharacterized protein n=1 Tax=Paxillus rubicundulus Ve08.2h10 TaxID=930991 RepID=A0A0D0DG21_9AGAM|nr:hypothetical protein PAXRUDRAFT_411832 [Paxillus rubicundulus Ve08.2h10]